MVNEVLLRNLVTCGERYRADFLFLERFSPPQSLRGNWGRALEFFFSRAFYQGRNDKVSERVECAALKVLGPRLSAPPMLTGEPDLKELRKLLGQKIGKGKVGKARDVEMVLDAFRFVSSLPSQNVVAYSIERIEAGATYGHFVELQKSLNPSGGIVSVGPKVASFYLRDVVSLFDLEARIPEEQQACLQPVDGWVRKVAARAGLVEAGAADDDVRHAIAVACRSRGYSPLLLNQGCWYAGARSFDLLMDALGGNVS
jgi:hypothetical protein